MPILGSAIGPGSEAFNSGFVENGMWEELEGGEEAKQHFLIFTDLSISLT